MRNKNVIEAAILNRVVGRDSTLNRRGPLRTQVMADEFNFLWSEIQNYIAVDLMLLQVN